MLDVSACALLGIGNPSRTGTHHLDEQRCAHTLSGDFGFSSPQGAQYGAGTTGTLASDAAGEMSGLRLTFARQVRVLKLLPWQQSGVFMLQYIFPLVD